MSDESPYLSRSQGEVDNRCRRERFFLTVYGGRGIIPVLEPVEFAFGGIVHDNITSNAQVKDGADLAAKAAFKQMDEWCKKNMVRGPQGFEYPILAAAQVYGFLYHVLTDYLQDYDIVMVEPRFPYRDPSGNVWPAGPDFLLRLRKDGTLWYLELKTTSLDPQKFSRIFQRKLQGHHGALATEQALGEPVEGVIIQGLHKGGKYGGHLRSRLVGGYRREGPVGVGRTTYRLEHGKGFEWFYSTEYPPGGIEGVKAWVRQLPFEVLAEAFPVTPPVMPDPAILGRFIRQRTYREEEIASFKLSMADLDKDLERTGDADGVEQSLEDMMDRVFPQNTSACEDEVTGRKCAYLDCCWNGAVSKNPLASGLYKPRPRYGEIEGQDEETDGS